MVTVNRVKSRFEHPWTAEAKRRIKEDRERAAALAWRGGFVAGVLFGALVATMFWVEMGR